MSYKPSFFFYDLETSGLSPREDRIMQFAGQRTDTDLNEIGEPVNLLVKLSDDTLPSPYAIRVTGITPQSTQRDGLTEAELCSYLQEEIFTPGTMAVGYNSVRFDDEFMRHLFWRNFYDPYEWQWAEGRSRWDLLDVVRMTRALRPEGIKWPVTPEGKATNRLELLTKLNGIEHKHAHDALSDVEALIAVTRLIREKQPQLYQYLLDERGKRAVAKLVNLEKPRPLVYTSGRYPSEFGHTTVVYPIAPGKNGNILVYDLRYNLEEVLAGRGDATSVATGISSNYSTDSDKSQEGQVRASAGETEGKARVGFFPIVKELALNKCPAVAPVGVLAVEGGWEKISLSEAVVQKNLKTLLKHPEFIVAQAAEAQQQPEWPAAVDAESALYDGFVPEPDKVRCAAVRNADANKLADFHPVFIDGRLGDLLLHYKARNYPRSLSEDEMGQWEKYRVTRLNRQMPEFIKGLEELEKQGADGYITEELKLWYQGLM